MKGCFAPGGLCGCCCELCQPVRCVIDQHEVEIIPATYRSSSSVTSSQRTYRSEQDIRSHRSQSGDPPTSRSTAVSSNVEHYSRASSRRPPSGGRHKASCHHSQQKQRDESLLGSFSESRSSSSATRRLKSTGGVSKNKPFYFERTPKHGLSPPSSSSVLHLGSSGSEGVGEASSRSVLSFRSVTSRRASSRLGALRKKSGDNACGRDIAWPLLLGLPADGVTAHLHEKTPSVPAQDKSAPAEDKSGSSLGQGRLIASEWYRPGNPESSSLGPVNAVAAQLECSSRSPSEILVAGVRSRARRSVPRPAHGRPRETDSSSLSLSSPKSPCSVCSDSSDCKGSSRSWVSKAGLSAPSSDFVADTAFENANSKNSSGQPPVCGGFPDVTSGSSCSTTPPHLETAAPVPQLHGVPEGGKEGQAQELACHTGGQRRHLAASYSQRHTRTKTSEAERLDRVEQQQHALLQVIEEQQRALELLANRQRVDLQKKTRAGTGACGKPRQNGVCHRTSASGSEEDWAKTGGAADVIGQARRSGGPCSVSQTVSAGSPQGPEGMLVVSSGSAGRSLLRVEAFDTDAFCRQASNLSKGDCESSGDTDPVTSLRRGGVCYAASSSTSRACAAPHPWPESSVASCLVTCPGVPSALAAPPVRRLRGCPPVELASRRMPSHRKRDEACSGVVRSQGRREETVCRSGVVELGDRPVETDAESSLSTVTSKTNTTIKSGNSRAVQSERRLVERAERSLSLSRRFSVQTRNELSDGGEETLRHRNGRWMPGTSHGAAVRPAPSRIGRGTDIAVGRPGDLTESSSLSVPDTTAATPAQATVSVSRGARLLFWHYKASAMSASSLPSSAPSVASSEGFPSRRE